jgi:hypothetical protein
MEITAINSELRTLHEYQPQWGHPSTEYEATVLSGDFTFSYHGRCEGWCNIIEEQRTAVSAYSSWFLFGLTKPRECFFELPNMSDYVVVNANYDESTKLWSYGGNSYDIGNIIALKKGCFNTIVCENCTVYYRFASERPLAECYANNYDRIISYYISIFPEKIPDIISIVLSATGNYGDAYFRKGLIFLTNQFIPRNISKIEDSTITLLGHELGHNWFGTANTSLWHDWLNETGAEWAMYLYLLKLGKFELFEHTFEHTIAECTSNYTQYPPIKPTTGEVRPADGVHARGVALFEIIYRKYGEEKIIEILRILSELEPVTTENYLLKLRSHGNIAIAEYIERSLLQTEYAKM